MIDRVREAYYARQKYLFALVFVLVSVVPLLILNFNASRFYQNSWLEGTSRELSTLAGDRKEIIDRFLVAEEDQLSGFLSFFDPRSLAEEARLEKLFKAMNRSGVIADIGIIDHLGRHRAYHGPFAAELADRNYADAEWFAEVMKSGRYVSDVFPGYRKVPHLVVAVADDERRWILRATINSAFFNSLLESANVGPDGDAYIVNRRGALQTPSRRGLGAPSPEQMELFEQLAGAGGRVARQGDHLVTAVAVNNGQWLLVLQANMAAALASYDKARRMDTAVVAIATVLIVLVAVALTHSMIGRLARAERERGMLVNRMGEMEKMALIGRLAASVAHEINNPLQLIGDQAGLMGDLMEDERQDALLHAAEYRRALDKIRMQTGRAGAITHRLLGFSHAPEGKDIATDINQAVEEAVAMFEHEARRHRIVLQRRYGAGLPKAVGDPERLQQVILNILHNAIDAIGKDGRIEIASRPDGDRVAVDFADSGPGLSDEVLDHLYDPFFTTKPKGKGTGLGLYVSREIMEKGGGRLTAANRPEGGAVFTLYLPAAGRGETPGAGAGV
jgi:two-component system NtrC family sensor kinase